MDALRPFWSDTFDMDLLKIIPDTRQILDAAGDVVLYTHGHTTHDRLNHPSVWHSNNGLTAFFGFANPAKPESYHASDPIVQCTFLEVMRDVWSHNYIVLVEKRLAVNGLSTWSHFEPLMYHVRSWRRLSENRANAEVEWVRKWIVTSRNAFLELAAYHIGLAAAGAK